jgi:hypothetical protein
MDTGIHLSDAQPCGGRFMKFAAKIGTMHPDSVLRMPDSLFTPASIEGIFIRIDRNPTLAPFQRIVNPTTDSRAGCSLEIANPNLRHVEVYQYWGELLIQSDTAGIDFPFERRPVPAQNFLFPMHLKAGDTLTCLVYVAPSYQPANFDLYLWQSAIIVLRPSPRGSRWFWAVFL